MRINLIALTVLSLYSPDNAFFSRNIYILFLLLFFFFNRVFPVILLFTMVHLKASSKSIRLITVGLSHLI
jgi:hypothetical protein